MECGKDVGLAPKSSKRTFQQLLLTSSRGFTAAPDTALLTPEPHDGIALMPSLLPQEMAWGSKASEVLCLPSLWAHQTAKPRVMCTDDCVIFFSRQKGLVGQQHDTDTQKHKRKEAVLIQLHFPGTVDVKHALHWGDKLMVCPRSPNPCAFWPSGAVVSKLKFCTGCVCLHNSTPEARALHDLCMSCTQQGLKMTSHVCNIQGMET